MRRVFDASARTLTDSEQQATTLTITNCPCTITRPVMTTSAVVCNGNSNWLVRNPYEKQTVTNFA